MKLSEALRAAASPALYRNNTFRATGRPVDTGPGEKAKRAEPVEKIIDAFFWFWSSGADADAAVAAGDLDRAEAIWERAGTDVARHNLAVLNHMIALDDEHEGKPLPRSGVPRRWRQAYQYWLAVWQSGPFWKRFAERAAQLGHPGPETAATFRDRLPTMLASISATVAIRCAERGLPPETAMVFWRLTNYSGFPAGTRAEATKRATAPIVGRIRAGIDAASKAEKKTPTDAGPAALRLHGEAAPLLAILASSGAPKADDQHDAVATAMMRCALIYHKKTNDRKTTQVALSLARSIARSPDLTREIAKELDYAGRTEYSAGGMMLRRMTAEESRESVERIRRLVEGP